MRVYVCMQVHVILPSHCQIFRLVTVCIFIFFLLTYNVVNKIQMFETNN